MTAAASASDLPRVAVLDFEVTHVLPVPGAESLGRVFATELEAELVASRRFTVITRTRLNEVLAEIGLSETGLTDRGRLLTFGEADVVDVLVVGEVRARSERELRVSMTGIEVPTGRIVFSDVADATSEGDFDRVAASFVAAMRGAFPVEGTVVVIEGTGAFVDVGTVHGVLPGDTGGALLRVRDVAGEPFPVPLGSFSVVQAAASRTLIEPTLLPGEALRVGDIARFDASATVTEEARAPPPSVGRVVVVVDPPTAQLVVGTRNVHSPFELPEGRHELAVRADGYLEERITLDVIAGETLRTRVALVRRQATIIVDVAPSDAVVRLDGVRRAAREFSVEPGVYALEVTAAGFEPFARRLIVAAGQVERVEVRLEPEAATLALNVDAPQFSVRVDERELGFERVLTLPPGTYQLRIEAPGRVPSELSVTLAPGESREVDVSLTRASEVVPVERAPSHTTAENDRLLIGSTSEVSGFDPPTSVDAPSFERINVIMEPLVVLDRGLGLRPRLATDWSFSDDGLTITFGLRDGVTWHDGEPFTAADVRFTFETVLDPETGAVNRYLYRAIETIDTPDDYTVVFRLNTPKAFLIHDIARQPIVPANAGDDFNVRPVGTGPYMFESHVRDDRLVVRRFDAYWGGAGSIEFLEFRVIPDDATRLLAFEAGEIDVTQGQLPPEDLPRLERDERFVLERTPGTGYTYLGLNTQSRPLDNVRVRQALGHLLPRDAIVQRLLNGNGFPGISMIQPTMPSFNPYVRRYDYDPELAMQLLEEAGVDVDRPLRLYTNDNPVRMHIAEILSFEFAQIGLELQVNIEEFGALLDRILRSDDYDMFILGWGGQLDPESATLRQFHSGEPGTSNFTYYSNPRVDELLDEGTVTDPTSRRSIEIYQEIQAIVVDEAPYIFINYTAETAAYHPWIGGWSVHPYGPNTFQDAHLITKNR